MNKVTYTLPFQNVTLKDIPLVGGKNASLGEMIAKLGSKGVRVPDGFATTANAYWKFIDDNGIRKKLSDVLIKLDTQSFDNLDKISKKAKSLIMKGNFPKEIEQQILQQYKEMGMKCSVAVRSSATAEDLPTASFAGQQETYLNVKGEKEVMEACKKCFASLFTARAIKYRVDNGFDHMKVALSIGIQQMVRSDKASSGVAFTIEPDTGFRDVIVINGIWGLGENIVQGTVDPDEFIVFKPAIEWGKDPIISRKVGKKDQTMVYNKDKSGADIINTPTPKKKQRLLVINDQEIRQLAAWCMIIEKHYKTAMDIEWAKDGITGDLYIVQARPETVHSHQRNPHILHRYTIGKKGVPLTKGIALGNKIAAGKARILNNPEEAHLLKAGEVLVTDITNPDWDPVMKKASAIVTNKGGRTSHAAIVARELGAVAVVGTADATRKIKDGQEVTVSCAEGNTGFIYDGSVPWKTSEIDTRKLNLPKTEVMFILADPEKAFELSFIPNNGVGLMRMEFVINNSILIHPMALLKFDELTDKKARKQIEKLTAGYKQKEDYFIDKLSHAVATVAAAFYPKDVIVRMSDFKSNEYANLVGGQQFEPHEENPMLGFRGASRYYNPRYKEGFRLECEAMKKVRNDMGLTNVKLMIPFCRTVDEGKKVVKLMADYGLKQGDNGLEIYTMVEIPANVILADEFAQVFDGFSIGSNDLTQLSLGLDRDSELVSDLFDENNEAVKTLISNVIKSARKHKTKIGLCGQAPSDFPEFAQFLVKAGIDSISFNADAIITGIKNISMAELQLKPKTAKV